MREVRRWEVILTLYVRWWLKMMVADGYIN
jgi:hypothetical protein